MISVPKYARITTMTDGKDWWRLQVDTGRRTARFTSSRDSADISSFQYNEPDKEHVQLNGIFHGDSLQITLKRIDLNSFTLMSRGFHWINEYPYNQ